MLRSVRARRRDGGGLWTRRDVMAWDTQRFAENDRAEVPISWSRPHVAMLPLRMLAWVSAKFWKRRTPMAKDQATVAWRSMLRVVSSNIIVALFEHEVPPFFFWYFGPFTSGSVTLCRTVVGRYWDLNLERKGGLCPACFLPSPRHARVTFHAALESFRRARLCFV